jgi:hypothetical protein
MAMMNDHSSIKLSHMAVHSFNMASKLAYSKACVQRAGKAFLITITLRICSLSKKKKRIGFVSLNLFYLGGKLERSEKN